MTIESYLRVARAGTVTLVVLLAANCALFYVMVQGGGTVRGFQGQLFTGIALLQCLVGWAVFVAAIKARTYLWVMPGLVGAIGAPFGWFVAAVGMALGSGGAWGRPLRVRGRQLHPELREGSDWTDGERPDPSALDLPTRRALEALWLHDAQKEHASVPAFARIAWQLAAVGAPAELMVRAHRAGLEEIDHTRRCFALAAGYGGRSHTVEPMPDLVLGMDADRAPLLTLAKEGLADGCQLEDFNADVAAACADVCEEPATKVVLEQIAREERSHAEFSWAVIEWLLERHSERVTPALIEAAERLRAYARPTAVAGGKSALVAAADATQMRRHGRLGDDEWGRLWDVRLERTRTRLASRLGQTPGAT